MNHFFPPCTSALKRNRYKHSELFFKKDHVSLERCSHIATYACIRSTMLNDWVPVSLDKNHSSIHHPSHPGTMLSHFPKEDPRFASAESLYSPEEDLKFAVTMQDDELRKKHEAENSNQLNPWPLTPTT